MIMNEQQRITMRDIARELGVSVATVSRALNDSPSISRERRETIQRYAREHNFTPNTIAKDLRNTRRGPVKIIGVIMPEIVHYYFSTVLDGIEAEASRRGYRIIVAQSHEEYEREVRICRSMYENRVCGLIVSLAKETKRYEHFVDLQAKGMPLVFYDRICHGINASRVVVDDYQGVYTAVSYLIETGCRRIAYYGAPLHLEISKNRFNGYKDALLKHGIKVDDNLVFICDNCESAERLTPMVLEMPERPDAFFAVNDDTAIGIVHACNAMGVRVPEEVSICGFSDGFRAKACSPRLTTVDQRGNEVGREAVDVLLSEVEGVLPSNKVNKRIVRTKLVVRGTTKEYRE